eukprot:gene10169-12475_t
MSKNQSATTPTNPVNPQPDKNPDAPPVVPAVRKKKKLLVPKAAPLVDTLDLKSDNDKEEEVSDNEGDDDSSAGEDDSLELSNNILDYLPSMESLFSQEGILTKSEVDSILRYPWPQNYYPVPPKLRDVPGYTFSKAVKSKDKELRIVQMRVIDALNPLLALLGHSISSINTLRLKRATETINSKASVVYSIQKESTSNLINTEVLKDLKDHVKTSKKLEALSSSGKKKREFSQEPSKKGVGCRLKEFVPVWKEMGFPNHSIKTIQGLRIDLLPSFKSRREALPKRRLDPAQVECIEKEVVSLLEEDAIEIVNNPQKSNGPVFYSDLFTVPKPGGGLRPVLDLREFNTHVKMESFKMEGIKDLQFLLKKDYYMAKLDLKKAYLHVPIAKYHQDLFRFQWKDKIYRWKALPFGLTSAPRIFTQVLKPVINVLRAKGISIIAYLDDLLIIGKTQEECQNHIQQVLSLLTTLGFTPNLEKSVLTPCQQLIFLGFLVDSQKMKLFIPQDKKKGVIKEIQSVLKKEYCSLRNLASVKGKLISIKEAVIPNSLYQRKTLRFQNQMIKKSKGNWEFKFQLPKQVKKELKEWIQHLEKWNGKEILLSPNPDYILETDASETGAGAVLYNHQHQPLKSWSMVWSQEESSQSSNRRETTAIIQAFNHLCQDLNNCSLLIRTDNTTALSYLKKQGGVILEISELIEEFWKKCLKRNIILSPEHIPGIFNVQADYLSRISSNMKPQEFNPKDHYGWTIKPQPSKSSVKNVLNVSKELPQSRLVPMEVPLPVSPAKDNSKSIVQDKRNAPFPQFDKIYINISPMDVSKLVPANKRSPAKKPIPPPDFRIVPRVSNSPVNLQVTTSSKRKMETSNLTNFKSVLFQLTKSRNTSIQTLISRSFSYGTHDVYNYCWNNWVKFTSQNNIHVLNFSPSNIYLFFNHLYDINLSYKTILSHRACLNQLTKIKDKKDLTLDPILNRIITGISKERPSNVKYNEIYDPEIVFKFIKLKYPVNSKLSFDHLLDKCIILVKLCAFARASDLAKWSYKKLEIQDNRIRGPLIAAKEQRSSNQQSIMSIDKLSVPSICPYSCLRLYLSKVASHRKVLKSSVKVFIFKDGSPVPASYISKVTKSFLQKAGIDITKFSAHSTRAAMASKALSMNINPLTVKNLGRWKSTETVEKFYHYSIIGSKNNLSASSVINMFEIFN